MALPVITSETSWQSLTVAVAIATGINRRCVVCGQNAISVPTKDTRVEDFIHDAQAALLGLANDGSWLDPAVDYVSSQVMPSPLPDGEDFFLSSALDHAGIWRRILPSGSFPADPLSYSDAAFVTFGMIDEIDYTDPEYYTRIEDYRFDAAGPWLFQDLITALGRMTRRKYSTVEYIARASPSQVSNPPTATGTPSYSMELSGIIQCLKRNRKYNDFTRIYALYVQHCSFSCSETGLPEIPITARMFSAITTQRRLMEADGSYVDSTPTLLGYANNTVYQLATATSSDGSVSLQGPARLSSWSSIDNLLSWPQNQPFGPETINSAYIIFTSTCVVVDFEFD